MRAVKQLMKASLPKPAVRVARFLYRLPVHFRADLSYQICAEEAHPHGTLFVGHGIRLQLPDHAVANSVFRSMAFESSNQQELRAFLALAKGRTRLCDVGASGGFFSALFAASRPSSSVLSIEFDKPSLEVLAQTRERNQRPGSTWVIDPRGVSDAAGTVQVTSSGYGGVAANAMDDRCSDRSPGTNDVDTDTYTASVDLLATICSDHRFSPDVIKVDIEGFEYEMIMSSSELLGDLKPHIWFELHVSKLRERGKSVEVLLDSLTSLGYRLAGSGRSLTTMLAHVGSDGTARAALVAS